MKKDMTRQEIETMLEKKYLSRVIDITIPYPPPTRGFKYVSGKVDRISIEITDKVPEPMVVFIINHERYTADVNYFIENAKLYGNPH